MTVSSRKTLRFMKVLHVSTQAVVFKAQWGKDKVAVKWTVHVDEPKLHRQAFRVIEREWPGITVPLLWNRRGSLTLKKIFPSNDTTKIEAKIRELGQSQVLTAPTSALLVMPLYTGSAQDIIDRDPELFMDNYYDELVLTVERAYCSLHDAGLKHGNPVPSNFLYRRKKWAITDFAKLQDRGSSTPRQEWDKLEAKFPS